ncbi:MAG TPA: hypothetical protein VEB21_13140 [Terriglobales bacterium]|nr:hypothetical protein [Terriglobales bacterium]
MAATKKGATSKKSAAVKKATPKKKSSAEKTAPWQVYLDSPGFRRRLRQLVVDEIEAIAATPLEQLIGRATVRAAIEQFDIELIDIELLTSVTLQQRQHLAARLQRRSDSFADLLGESGLEEIERVLESAREVPPYVEELVTTILEHEFVQRLLTDLIYTAIAAFYRKVNPLFGGMATRMLEEQIKGFIRLFMPTLQQQAVGFATSKANQRALLDFAAALVRQLLEEPMATYGKVLGGGDARQLARLIEKVVTAPELDRLAQQLALDACDDVFERYGKSKVGKLIDLEARSHWLAAQIDRLVSEALQRPAIISFIAASWQDASGGAS